MKTKSLLLLAVLIFTVIASGCETVNKGASEVGKVAGAGTKVLDSVSEGAVDGYMGESKQANPYNR